MNFPVLSYPDVPSGLIAPDDILHPLLVGLGEQVLDYSFFDILDNDPKKLYESTVSFRKILRRAPLLKSRLWNIGRIKHRGDALYFEITDTSLYYDARSAAKRMLLWDARSKKIDYPATLRWWRTIMDEALLDASFFERIERNDLSDPLFADIATDITLERLARHRRYSGDRLLLVKDTLV